MDAAAHLAGRFLLTFSLAPSTSVAALSSMLAGDCQAVVLFKMVLLKCQKIHFAMSAVLRVNLI